MKNTLLSILGVVISGAVLAAPSKVTYQCQFSKHTNGFGIVDVKSATLHLTPGSDEMATLYIGTHSADIDAYWSSHSKGINMHIWDETASAQHSGVHSDAFAPLSINLQNSGPDGYKLSCKPTFIK